MKRDPARQSDNGEPSRPQAPTTLRGAIARYLWLSLALFFVGLGSIGVVVPLMPTTVFLLMAAYCASRSSPALHAWLYSHHRFGPLLRDWRDHRAIRPRAKVTAIILVAISGIITWMTVEALTPRLIALGVLLCVIVFLITRPHGPDNRGSRSTPPQSGQGGNDE